MIMMTKLFTEKMKSKKEIVTSNDEIHRVGILPRVVRGSKDLFLKSITGNDDELVNMIYNAYYDYTTKYHIDMNDLNSPVEDKKISESLFDRYLKQIDAYRPKAFKVIRINEINIAINAKSLEESKQF